MLNSEKMKMQWFSSLCKGESIIRCLGLEVGLLLLIMIQISVCAEVSGFEA
jgi:hypothetical protein